jgi:hypothetical protein
MAISHVIIAAAHARGTHHYLALDALDRLTNAEAGAWKDLFYAHIERFVEGSKAPDNEFKDFKNHVLHPRDNYWGGAPERAQAWYDQCVAALKANDWDKAAYAAGVLSHYVSDPCHPFHTAQSEAENCIHRACEWSINRSYAALRDRGQRYFPEVTIPLSSEPNWLARLICHGADTANARYEKLIAHYDIHRGVVDPPSGLDEIARSLVAEMIMMATEICAIVFDKALADAGAAPPPVSLLTKALGAIAKLPKAWMLKRVANIEERKLVERMYDELRTTGTVEANLPEDDRTVRDQHKIEVLDARPKPDIAKIFPFNPSPAAVARVEQSRIAEVRAKGRPPEGRVIAMEPARPAPARRDAPPIRTRADVLRQIEDEVKAAGDAEQVQSVAAAAPVITPAPQPAAAAAPIETTPAAASVTADSVVAAPAAAAAVTAETPAATPRPRTLDEALAQGMPGALAAAIATITPFSMVSADRSNLQDGAKAASVASARPDRADKVYLTLEHDIVDAPSIGPKTADRMRAVGVDTVDDFLKSHPIALAARLDAKHITPDVITDWQDQARLVMAIPGLRGTHAQYLVGAGFRSAEAVTAAEPEAFCAAVLAYVGSSEGQRILRDGTPPDVERIKGWLNNAKAAKAA